ncbi:hypothetical protein VNI00_010431 [Paramarasmius palmivorus]|uniref:EH domain-containing protein n=1 Tax=Paramarasmius palmivorus TaxID=297713 RepID=A0AAW0CJJ1_9AGAR
MSRVQSRIKAFESGSFPKSSENNTDDADAPLINFQDPLPPSTSSPPSTTNAPAPPLPPRKPSPNSTLLRVDSPHTYPPKHGHSSSISSFHSVSLSDNEKEEAGDGGGGDVEESYENISVKQLVRGWGGGAGVKSTGNGTTTTTNTATGPPKLPQRRPTASSTSSSSSTSSLRIPTTSSPSPITPITPITPISPTTSTSSASTVILPSPIRERAPSTTSTTSMSSFSAISPPSRTHTLPPTPTGYAPYLRKSPSNHSLNSGGMGTITRKPPPPPIPAAKPKPKPKSTPNNAGTRTSRPTPVPATARRRYEAVFDENVRQGRRAKYVRQRERRGVGVGSGEGLLISLDGPGAGSGWRGDQHQHSEDEEVWKPIQVDDRLPGCVIKVLWGWSRLPKHKLKEIWAECDVGKEGSLDKNAFVVGMWRIDEELRKAEVPLPKIASRGSTTILAPSRTSSVSSTRTNSNTLAIPVPVPRPVPNPIQPVQQGSPTSSTSSFTSISTSVSPSSSTGVFGSYVSVGRVGANGVGGSESKGDGSIGKTSTRRKPPPPPPVMQLGLPT